MVEVTTSVATTKSYSVAMSAQPLSPWDKVPRPSQDCTFCGVSWHETSPRGSLAAHGQPLYYSAISPYRCEAPWQGSVGPYIDFGVRSDFIAQPRRVKTWCAFALAVSEAESGKALATIHQLTQCLACMAVLFSM
jgi:hypothetical protein